MNFYLVKFLWLLFVGAGLGVLLGWWLWGRRYAQEKQEAANEARLLRSSFDSVNAELKACRKNLAAAEGTAQKPAATKKPAPAATAKPEPKAEETRRSPAAAPMHQATAQQAPAPKPAASPTPESLGEDEPAPDEWKPNLLAQPQGEKDDLKQIKGVGPKIEGILNDLGIYHFSQVAAFTEENIAWVNTYLKFKGRIQREKWIEQAKQLAAQK